MSDSISVIGIGKTGSLIPMLPAVLFIWFGLADCRNVEIARQPQTLHLIVSGSTDNSAIWIDGPDGRVKVEKRNSGIFEIRLPLLRGGYSEFLSVKYNRHLPQDYKIIVITEREKTVKRLSAAAIQRLPRDKTGNYIFTLK